MTQTTNNYVRELYSLRNASSYLQSTASIIEAVPAIGEELCDPTVAFAKKEQIIDRIFPREIRNFLKLLCENGDFDLFDEIVADYKTARENSAGKVSSAKLRYVTEPTEEQLDGIRKFLAKEYDNEFIEIKLEQDESLKSGFVLSVGTKEYDWSEQGRIDQLTQKLKAAVGVSSVDQGILSILKSSISDFELEAKDQEVGIVKWVGDGIANVDGIDHAFYGEIVIFDCGVNGMVQDIRRDEIGVILFGRDTDVKEGSKVVRTGKMAGIPVGDAFLGRIVNALGEPLDGMGDIDEAGFPWSYCKCSW